MYSSESSSSSAPSAPALSEREGAVYDRQLRLWGVETQQRMKAAHVLVAGLSSGLGAEAAKNLVLLGLRVSVADARALDGAAPAPPRPPMAALQQPPTSSCL